MENKLKCYPVMLPTKQSHLAIIPSENRFATYNPEFSIYEECGDEYKPQHLYFVSYENTTLGDTVLFPQTADDIDKPNGVGRIIKEKTDHVWEIQIEGISSEIPVPKSYCRRIEATRDPLSMVASIPEDWIMKEYVPNKGKIKEVYIQATSDGCPAINNEFRNEVIILSSVKLKDTWNREEFKKELGNLWDLGNFQEGDDDFEDYFNRYY